MILPDFLSGISVPANNLLYNIAPRYLPPVDDVREAVFSALDSPVESPPLRGLVHHGDRVLIIADDLTRPTPQHIIIPPLLEVLEECGIADKDIEILIALGTHRPMSRDEIISHFGPETAEKVKISNHEFADPDMVIEYGAASDGTPITINRRLSESDIVIGLSSIVPHAQIGWGGGCKIVLPGVSGEKTVEAMHLMAAGMPDYPRFAGQVENPVRALIEEVAQKAGLDFILNVVFNTRYEVIMLAAGHPVKAHRAGVAQAREVFIRDIPGPADIVITNAHPADLEYWQGLKPVTLASLGLKKGGIIILVGAFPDGVSQSHGEIEMYGSRSPAEIDQLVSSGTIKNGLCLGALYQHSRVREWARVFCVSPGLSPEQKEHLGFSHFENTQEALNAALEQEGGDASIGVIDQGGEVVPRIQERG